MIVREQHDGNGTNRTMSIMPFDSLTVPYIMKANQAVACGSHVSSRSAVPITASAKLTATSSPREGGPSMGSFVRLGR